METTNEGEVAVLEAEVETLEESTEEEQDTTDWKAKYEEAKGMLKRAETKLEKSKIEKKAEEIVEKQSKTGELDENALAFLDVKGITDQDEIDLIHTVMKKTGQTLREALRDDYVQTKLAKLRSDHEKLDATPGSTRRAENGSVGSIDYWKARYEQKGELPKDFALKSAVINAVEADHNGNKPAWR